MLNKYLYIYVRIILFLVIGAFLCCLYSCTPQQKLNRLLKKHPDLIKTDTVFAVRSFTIPEQVHDTTFTLDTAGVVGLLELLDSLLAASDSAKPNIKYIIKEHYLDRPVIKDTFVVSLANGGYVKLYQVGRELRHKLFQPAYTRTVSVPVESNTIVYNDIPWRLAWYWVLIAFVCGIAVGMYLIYKKQKPG